MAKGPGCWAFPQSASPFLSLAWPLASEPAAGLHSSPPSLEHSSGLASQEVVKCKEEVGASHNCRNLASKGSNLSVSLSASGEVGHKSWS